MAALSIHSFMVGKRATWVSKYNHAKAKKAFHIAEGGSLQKRCGVFLFLFKTPL